MPSTPPDRATIEAYIRATAKQYKIDPDQAVRQCQAESGFDQTAASPKGAVGLFQLMPPIARQLGIDRSDWKQNVTGAMHYMAQLSRMFGGDQQKTLAAYNWGPGNLANAIKQYGEGYQAHLPAETESYLAKIYRNPDNAGAQA